MKSTFLTHSWKIALCSLLSLPVLGQNTVMPSRQLDQGSWSLQTDPKSRTTRIEFFNKRGELLYQETLNEQYIKLNSKNIRRFDALLTQLAGQQLVANQVKSETLPVFVPKHNSKQQQEEILTLNGDLQANIRLSKVGKLKVSFLNPRRERVIIFLQDKRNNVLYELSVFNDRFSQHLDVTQLALGQYTLLLKTGKNVMRYPFDINQSSDYRLVPTLPASHLACKSDSVIDGLLDTGL